MSKRALVDDQPEDCDEGKANSSANKSLLDPKRNRVDDRTEGCDEGKANSSANKPPLHPKGPKVDDQEKDPRADLYSNIDFAKTNFLKPGFFSAQLVEDCNVVIAKAKDFVQGQGNGYKNPILKSKLIELREAYETGLSRVTKEEAWHIESINVYNNLKLLSMVLDLGDDHEISVAKKTLNASHKLGYAIVASGRFDEKPVSLFVKSLDQVSDLLKDNNDREVVDKLSGSYLNYMRLLIKNKEAASRLDQLNKAKIFLARAIDCREKYAAQCDFAEAQEINAENSLLRSNYISKIEAIKAWGEEIPDDPSLPEFPAWKIGQPWPVDLLKDEASKVLGGEAKD